VLKSAARGAAGLMIGAMLRIVGAALNQD